MKANPKHAAVVVEDRRASLTVSYSVRRKADGADLESDSNSFSEIIGGREDLTEAQAVAAVVECAQGWANNFRAEHPDLDLGVWDSTGNCY